MLANKLRGGGLAVVISITNQAIPDFGSAISDAYYSLGSSGNVFGGISAFDSILEQWVTPTARAIDYEAKVTLVSGTLTGGTTGSWLPLSSDRSWYTHANAGGYKTCTFTVEIRRAGVGTVLDSATITVTADAI